MRSFQAAVLAAALVIAGPAGVAAAEAKDYCAELKGANTGEKCQIRTSEPGYTVDISFPLSYDDQKSVAEYITQKRDEFLNVAKSSAPRDQPYRLTISPANYASLLPPRGSEAVVFTVNENTGAGSRTTFKSFNWDQGWRKSIVWTAEPDDKNNTPLWRVDDPLKVVAPIVLSELQKQAAPPAPPTPAPETPETETPTSETPTSTSATPTPTAPPLNIAPAVLYNPNNYQSFAITNDGVVFFFDQGEMVPEATEVLVPRSEIDPMIA